MWNSPDRRIDSLTLLRARGFFLRHVLFQPRQAGLGDVLHQPARHVAFEAAARLEDVVGFFQAGARHRRAAIGTQVDQPLAEQARQHAAHDGAADAETLADDVLGQFVARQQGLLDDRLPQVFVYDFRAVYVFPCGLRRVGNGGRHLVWISDACAFRWGESAGGTAPVRTFLGVKQHTPSAAKG